MPFPRFVWLRRLFGGLWWLIDGTRRLVFNLIFLAILVAIGFTIARSGPAPLADKTTLVLNLHGALVEQRSSSARDTALAQIGGGQVSPGTQLRDVLAVLDAAGQDPQIHSVLLVLDDFKGAGLPALREVAAALGRFKATGKPVLAWGSGYDQRQYYLAAHANQVYMHPMGMLVMQGVGGYRNYYREAFDRVGVAVELVRAGNYKNAGEIYVADGPSPESIESSKVLYDGVWSTYTQGVEQARKLPEGTLMALIDNLPERLQDAGGDVARVALDHKLVDALKTRDQLRDELMKTNGTTLDGKNFRQIAFDAYLARLVPKLTGPAIGVIVAEGAIIDGPAPAGMVGGLSTADLIRQARLDDKIKAVVLRVNSPGGSPFGSELIRRELELARAAGKPVVVSMGDVAASGGYWISMAADEVVADAATITGSIGVFALLPRVDKALEKLGVHTAGTGTTWLVGAGDPRRPLDPRFASLLQTHILQTYSQFTLIAAKARNTKPEKIDEVAQGRVWTGSQARERGLVDTIGNFQDALASAAKRAQITGSPRVVYIEPERSRVDRLIGALGGAVAKVVSDQLDARVPALQLGAPDVVRQAQEDLSVLSRSADPAHPFAALAHCLCTPY